MNILNRKLRSERGASISFALLLFLVCATVGSVILVAATSASGRLSRLAESDRRYYSVTSAAALFQEKYNGAEDVIVEEVSTQSTQTYAMDGTPKGDPSVVTKAPVITVNGKETGADTVLPVTADAALQLASDSAQSSPYTRTMTLEPEHQSTQVKQGLAVQVEETLTDKGQLSLQISSGGGAGAGSNPEVYRLCLTFEADRAADTDVRTTEGTPEYVSPGEYQITTTTTTKTTTKFTWRLSGVETVR